MGKRDLAGTLLVRRIGRRDKDDAVEPEPLLCLFSNAQVRQVNRIECAAQDTGFHRISFVPGSDAKQETKCIEGKVA